MNFDPQIVIVAALAIAVGVFVFVKRAKKDKEQKPQSAPPPSMPLYSPPVAEVRPTTPRNPDPTPAPYPSQQQTPAPAAGPTVQRDLLHSYPTRQALLDDIARVGSWNAVMVDSNVVHSGGGPARQYFTQSDGSVSMTAPVVAPPAPAQQWHVGETIVPAGRQDGPTTDTPIQPGMALDESGNIVPAESILRRRFLVKPADETDDQRRLRWYRSSSIELFALRQAGIDQAIINQNINWSASQGGARIDIFLYGSGPY